MDPRTRTVLENVGQLEEANAHNNGSKSNLNLCRTLYPRTRGTVPRVKVCRYTQSIELTRQVFPPDHLHETILKLANGVMTGSAIASASNGVN
mmetsp:Transcript_24245/g.36114  ORF Transcript_24245/g.36114 Transcript_24245/m.36114 type:complete len:93 (-) Transcript_24245:642-920(-)